MASITTTDIIQIIQEELTKSDKAEIKKMVSKQVEKDSQIGIQQDFGR